MKKPLSLVSLLGKRRSVERLPDLGERELGVLQVLWQTGPLTAQGVLEGVGNATVSLSTVQSTLERLYRKRLMHDIADSLTEGDTAPMVSGFLDYLDDHEIAGETDVPAASASRRPNDDQPRSRR